MPTLDPPESFTLPFKLADQCLAVIAEVCCDEKPTSQVLSQGFQSAFRSDLEIVLKHLRQILPELEHAITPEIEGAASKVAVEYYRLAGPRQKCALLAVKSGCAFILKARHVFTLPTAPADYAMLGGDLHAVAWPKRKDVEALRDGLAAECKRVARELSSAQGQPALSPLPNAPADVKAALLNSAAPAPADQAGSSPAVTDNTPPDLSPAARGMAQLIEHPGWTNKQIAKAVGVNPSTIYRSVEWEPFRNARAIQKRGRLDFPVGQKDKNGNVKASRGKVWCDDRRRGRPAPRPE